MTTLARIAQPKRRAGGGSLEEHPVGSGLYRFRATLGGKLVTIASGVDAAIAAAARAETVPRGRVVYLLLNPRMRQLKIGWSDDVPKRRRRIETLLGYQLELLGTFRGGRSLERLLHVAFADQRAGGEWFFNRGTVRRLTERLRAARGEHEASGPTARAASPCSPRRSLTHG